VLPFLIELIILIVHVKMDSMKLDLTVLLALIHVLLAQEQLLIVHLVLMSTELIIYHVTAQVVISIME